VAWLDDEVLDSEMAQSVLVYLEILLRGLRQTKLEAMSTVYKPVYRLFLSIFDYRREVAATVSASEVVAVEVKAVGAFVQLVLKLSDNAFRPLFLRTVDWALVDLGESGEADEAGRRDRSIVLFRLVDRLLGQFKVRVVAQHADLISCDAQEVVSPYFNFVLDATLEALEGAMAGKVISLELWDLVASSLIKGLLYGVEGTPSALPRPGAMLSTPQATGLRTGSRASSSPASAKSRRRRPSDRTGSPSLPARSSSSSLLSPPISTSSSSRPSSPPCSVGCATTPTARRRRSRG
jgi:hypothetical protein